MAILMEHMKDLIRKEKMQAARKVWGLGESFAEDLQEIYRKDFKKRWILFRYLVQSVEYGEKI